MHHQPNHSWLEPFTETWEAAVTDGRLYNLGAFPAFVLRDGQVHGELVHLIPGQVSHALARLDYLEEFRADAPKASMFLRVVVPVVTAAKTSVEAFAYVYNIANQTLPPIENFPVIEDGRWT